MLRSRLYAALALAATLSFAPAADAALILGEFLGNGSGENDSVEAILDAFGLDVTLLVRIDGEMLEGNVPDVVTLDGFSVFNFIENGGEIVAGEWSYAGPEIGDLIAVKAGPNWGVWRYTDALTGGMPNMGLFDTQDLDPEERRQAGDITLYHINTPVPEPSVLALVGLGLLGLGVTRHRRVG